MTEHNGQPSLASAVQRQLLLWIVLPGLMFVVLLGGYGIFQQLRSFERRSSMLANSLAEYVDAYMRQAFHTLNIFADRLTGADPGRIRRTMSELLVVFPNFERLIWLDRRGLIRAVVPSGAEGMDFPLRLEEISGDNLILSRPTPSNQSGRMVIYIGQRTRTGEVLICELNLELLQQRSSRLLASAEDSVVVADAFGNLIVHPDPRMVAWQENIGHLPMFRQKPVPERTMFRNENGRLQVGAVAVVPSIGWRVIIERSLASVVKPVARDAATLLALMLLCFVVLLLHLRGRMRFYVIRPLQRFTSTIKDIAQGRYGEGGGQSQALMAEYAMVEREFQEMASRVRRREEDLRKSEERFRQLVENVREAFLSYDVLEDCVEYVSPSFGALLDIPVREFLDDPRSLLDSVVSSDRARLRSLAKAIVTTGRPADGEFRILRSDESLLWVRVNAFPVFGEGNQVVRVVAIADDVTDRRKYEDTLRFMAEGTAWASGDNFFRELAMRLAQALQSDYVLLAEYVVDPPVTAKTLAIWGPPGFMENMEYDLAGTPCADIYADRLCIHPANVQKLFPEDTILQEMDVDSYLGLALRDSRNRAIGHLAILDRSTSVRLKWHLSIVEVFASRASAELERQRVEQRLTASLGEKDILLKEIHHRVKNNLQIISSLLSLQTHYVEDEAALIPLRESRNRITSMALVHEELYRSGDLSSISLGQYIKVLASKLKEAYGRSEGVRLLVDTEDMGFPVSTAVPCGLILNELVTNSLKHGFKDRETGLIRISLADLGEQVELAVADDGAGLPEGFDPLAGGTLGMELVQSLVSQLGGRLRFAAGAETIFTVTFPHTSG